MIGTAWNEVPLIEFAVDWTSEWNELLYVAEKRTDIVETGNTAADWHTKQETVAVLFRMDRFDAMNGSLMDEVGMEVGFRSDPPTSLVKTTRFSLANHESHVNIQRPASNEQHLHASQSTIIRSPLIHLSTIVSRIRRQSIHFAQSQRRDRRLIMGCPLD